MVMEQKIRKQKRERFTCDHVAGVVVWIEWCQPHAFELFGHDIAGLLQKKSEVTIHCHFGV